MIWVEPIFDEAEEFKCEITDLDAIFDDTWDLL